MRKIKLIWETTTGELHVDSFDNITRNDLYELELHNQSRGSNYLLGEDEVITAVGKLKPEGAVLVKVENFTRPSNALLPYTATIWIGGEDLNTAFQDGDQEHEFLDLKFELQSSGGPNTSARVPLRVHNELTREGEEWVPPGLTPSGGKVDVQVFHESGTWIKPVGAVWTEGLIVGGSSGATSGCKMSDVGATTTVFGGAGSQAGGVMAFSLSSDNLEDTEPVVVGLGGLGGIYNGAGYAAGQAGGNSSMIGLTALGGNAPTNANAVPAQTEKCLYPGVIQPSDRNILASGAGGRDDGGFTGGALPNTGTALTQRTPTGGGGGGGVHYNETTGVWHYGRGGFGGTIGGRNQYQTSVAGGTAGDDTTAGSDGQDGKIDPISGFSAGASGGGSGRLGGGHGGNGRWPGGAAGGGASVRGDDGDLPGNGGNGADGMVIVKTYCK